MRIVKISPDAIDLIHAVESHEPIEGDCGLYQLVCRNP